MPRQLRRSARAALVVGLLLLLVACQARVEVAVDADTDGSGLVTVRLGLDDEALDALGDPSSALRVDDLRQAGWAIEGPVLTDDGFTWLEAAKPFADADELTFVLDEVAGPDGVLSGFGIEAVEGEDRTFRLSGTVDLSGGLAAFADPELVALLGQETLDGLVASAEAAEGRPVSEQIDVRVTAQLGDQTQILAPRLGDAPVAVDVVAVEPAPTSPVLWGVGALAALGALASLLVLARRRFRSVGR